MPSLFKKIQDVCLFQLKMSIKQDRRARDHGCYCASYRTNPWINNMVAVRKLNKLRLCLDPLHLNKGIIRNHYPMPTVEDITPMLTKAKVFSVVDVKDGFLQVVLDEPSSYLTTSWTPFQSL